MPEVKDRLEILEVLLRGVDQEDDVDLENVAENCQGMTGADLRGLVYTATMSARKRGGEAVRVCQEDMLQATASTSPSVTQEEVLKYDKIYSRLQSGKLSPSNTEQRATLA